MAILGPDGRPVSAADLEGEVAGATLVGVRSHAPTYPTDGLSAWRLASLLRQADHGDPRAYFEMAEEIEEKDPHYLGILSTRKRAVAQLPVTVTPASEDAAHQAHARLIQDWLDTGVLQAALFDIMDAVGKGLSVIEIEWETNPARSTWPKELHWRPQRFFGFDDIDRDTVMLLEGVTKLQLPPHKFLIQRIKAKSGLTLRSGLARVAAWTWMFKVFTQKDWAIFTQNFGQPIRVGRYDASASPADREVLWRAVSQIAGDCAAVIPKGMEIEFIGMGDSAKSGSLDLYMGRCDWLDRQLSKLVLGQTTTTEAQKGAGNELGKVHRQVQEDIETADAMAVSAMLTRDLIPLIVSFNFGPQDAYPRLALGRPDETELSEVIDALAKLGGQGLEAEAAELRERLGLRDPAPGAVLVGGRRAAPVPGAPGLPGAPDLPDVNPAGPFGALSAHARRGFDAHDMAERLTDRLARDAQGALAGLTDEVRAALERAVSLEDALMRLAALDLDPEAMTLAMTRGLALAHLAGQAALLDELASDP